MPRRKRFRLDAFIVLEARDPRRAEQLAMEILGEAMERGVLSFTIGRAEEVHYTGPAGGQPPPRRRRGTRG